MKKNEINMAEGPLLKKLIAFSIPLVLTGILQILYSNADMVIVGKFAGNDPLAAVGATASLINICVGFFMGISTGAGIVVAQFYGAQHEKEVRNAVHTSIALGVVCGIILTALGILLTPVLLRAFDTPENIFDLSAAYMRIYFLGATPSLIYNFGAAALRAIGDTKVSLYFLSISGIVNILLNLLFVIVFKMSVSGVAIATVISQVVSAVLIIIYMMRLKNWCRLVPRNIKIHPRLLSKILLVGVPSALQAVVFSLSNSIIQSGINSFGSTVIAGNTAAMSIENLTYIAMNGISNSVATASGQISGAGKVKRLNKLLVTGILVVTACGLIINTVIFLFSSQVLSIYTSDPAAIQAGITRINTFAFTYFLCGIMEVVMGTLRGMGNAVLPMLNSIIGSCLLRVVWVKFIFTAFPTLMVLYMCYPVSWIITILAHLVCFFIVRHNFAKRLQTKMAAQDI